MRNLLFLIVMGATALIALWLSPYTAARPAAQVLQFSTPTPGPDGRIIYIVQPADTCIRVSLLMNIPVTELRAKNNLDEACTLFPGQELFIGYGGPSGSPTPNSTLSPSQVTPTPTPLTGTGQICVLLYDDQNGDALHQETEAALAGGAISVVQNDGTYSQTGETQGGSSDTEYTGVCFADVPPGEYTVSVGTPDDYNPTTGLTTDLKLNPGDQSYLDFGAQGRTQLINDPESGGRSPVIGLAGLVFLAAGGALGWYAWQSRGGRKPSQLR
jgi:LysM domain-containing protein